MRTPKPRLRAGLRNADQTDCQSLCLQHLSDWRKWQIVRVAPGHHLHADRRDLYPGLAHRHHSCRPEARLPPSRPSAHTVTIYGLPVNSSRTARALAAVAAGRETGRDGSRSRCWSVWSPSRRAMHPAASPCPAAYINLATPWHDSVGNCLNATALPSGVRSNCWAAEAKRSGLSQLVLPEAAGREQALAGLRGGRHHMGTLGWHCFRARASWIRTAGYGVPNLFLTGSLVFLTAGHANPTLTILALALRLADAIRSDARALIHERRAAQER